MNHQELYRDPALSPVTRADLLLAELSIAEKISQLNCYFPREFNFTDLPEAYPQGVGQISCLQMRALNTLDEAAAFAHEVQEKAMGLSPHHIPAILHMEGLCGAYIPGATSFPSGIGRASGWDPALEEQIGRIVARQESALGITQTFAPVLDVSRDSRMGRQGETYGEDPTLAATLGTALTRGIQGTCLQGRNSESVAKHFLGFHQGEGGIHGAHCDIPDRTLREIFAKPFQAAISEASLRGIMPCYGSINGEPVSASQAILTRLLRDEMGFEGITVSDYCAIMNIFSVQKVCESYTAAGLRAMSAGMDMELHFQKCYNDELASWFTTGRADLAILDRAVRRVLTAKFRMGLFENPFGLQGDALRNMFFQPGDQAVTRRSALQSLVLLKNDGVLPLRPGIRKIAVIGYHAGTARAMFGGYTHFSMREGLYAYLSTMAGVKENSSERPAMATYPGSNVQIEPDGLEALLNILAPEVKSLLQQLQVSLPQTEIVYSYGYPYIGDDQSGHETALTAAADADLVILTLGGKHGTSSIASMGEGLDTVDINLPPCQELFIEKLAALGKPAVGIHFNGRPISSDIADKHLNAILEAWNPAEMGAPAIVDVLLGVHSPSGRLPVSVAYCAGQIPVYYNHPNGSSFHQGESIGLQDYIDRPHKPRYPFGFGLSYTRFHYSDLTLSATGIAADGLAIISLQVQNTGDRPGTEVVQLYISDRYASMTRPCQELAGFARVELQPGEIKRVEFKLEMSQLAFLDEKMRWKVEAGDIDVRVGSSADDIRLTGSFRIMNDGYIDGRTREFYAASNITG
ncbi:MAG TPA: beta-glucosidase [Clostridiales bacterium]|nr:beta-glucosidase [Clostridiales bacterium]